jgi:hypothetical protein
VSNDPSPEFGKVDLFVEADAIKQALLQGFRKKVALKARGRFGQSGGRPLDEFGSRTVFG